jgi:cation:H+ antiporter
MEIGEGVIAQSLVALGTSLPEVFVSIAAARKGQMEMAVGNVLGSNIFNTYAVMGIPALLGTLVIPDDVLVFGLPLMIALTLILAVICITKVISRWEGLMFLLFYVFFLVKLFV